ncbi:extracellular solute-binding protein [Pararhodobacter zhoushanensis]|uniref:Extracellular solute-binding protein n=1 Tax=Pararhodobacter zhoushanensis TaxID=2479545 RepID=A0ABT3H0I1_9RHOB|nr:extracellular solute-binding protein [Pararhodobacter zhoushanensis]MCW1933288.1 extracellular solute-binding protein [Pararhodobacter zhoushanensis]
MRHRADEIVLAEVGGFDSLNPFILRGSAPWGVNLLTVQSLLGRSYDEPFALYGALAETVETDSARSYVDFTLRDGIRFSDGSPVTLDDVMWSFETMGLEGHPRYRNAWTKVATMEATGPRTLRLTFTEPDREMPLILGLRPIVQRAQFDVTAGGRSFADSSLQPVIGSGPYVVSRVDPGRSITFERVADWWGNDLPLFRGQYNLQEIRYEYYSDLSVAFEGFKAGVISVWREPNAARWRDSYDFPAMTDGRMQQIEIPHERPSGMSGFYFNTRRPIFADWRVRQALISAFDFEQINTTINDGAEPRITSYFGNSVLGLQPGPAEGRVAALLAPYADSLPPGAIDGYTLPVSDGRSNRRNLRAAARLLNDAGWHADAQGVLRNEQGQAFDLEILLLQGQTEIQTAAASFIGALHNLGINARVSLIDSAQYVQRTNEYNFDMTYTQRLMSLSPGNEQVLYWGSQGVTQPGSRNWAGVDQPAVDALIETMLSSQTTEDFTAAVRALDRVLMAGRYAIPFWFSPVSRLAASRTLHFPQHLPIYGDWTGFMPEVWWYQE